jgi:lysophospholipase L1-like esterase
MTRYRSRIAPGLSALALSAVVCGTAAEVFLRYSCLTCSWSERNEGTYVSPYRVPFNHSWYRVRTPNIARTYGLPDFDYELRTNSLGIRDIEHPVDKPPGEFRIVGIGDSFTEGQGAAFENGYLKVLEKKLNERLQRPRVAVVIGGVSGSDPFFGYKLLTDKLLRYQPDLVTLAINNSDVYDVVVRGGNERFLPDGTVRFADPPWGEWFFARSHVYRAVVSLLGYDWLGLSPSEHIVETGKAVELLKSIVSDYRGLADRENCRFLVILHPDLSELSSQTYAFDAVALKEYFLEKRIDHVDLMEYFLKRTRLDHRAPEELYWKNDFHHNEAGYRIFAEGLEEYLMANRFIGTGAVD